MTSKNTNPTTVRRVAPEDLRCGTYVAVMHVINQETPLFCDADASIREFWLIPCRESRPLKVLDVCLPFVFVEAPSGALRTLDVRRHRLARLDTPYARRVVKALRHAKRKKRSRRGET